MKPWETLGISRATYFREKRSLTDETGKVSDETTGETRAGLCETHPDKPHDITREQMKAVIDAGQSFVPNWYANGFPCKEAGIQKAIENVRKNAGVRKTALT